MWTAFICLLLTDTKLKERRIYPIDIIKGLVHTTQNFVSFAKKFCQQEAISSAKDYFQPPKFLKCQKLQGCR